MYGKSFPHFPQVFPQGVKCGGTPLLVYIKIYIIKIISHNFLPNYHFDNTKISEEKISIDREFLPLTGSAGSKILKNKNFYKKRY